MNAAQKRRLVDKMAGVLGSLDGRRIAVWGLSFKPRTDDMREAPSITVIEALLAAGAEVAAYDPQANESARRIFDSRITLASDSYDVLKGADALAILTEWNEFREPDFPRMRGLMRGAAVFDGRNLFEPAQMRELGFSYHSIGRR